MQKIGAESLPIEECGFRNAEYSSAIRSLNSAIQRPLEPDTVSTVEGRNKQPGASFRWAA